MEYSNQTSRRIISNATILATSEIISKILEFMFFLLAARILNASGFGLLSFALAFTGLFSFLTDMGLFPLSIREISKKKFEAKKYLADILGLKILLNLTVFTILLLTITLLNYPQQTTLLVTIIGISMVLESFRYAFDSVFQANEKLKYTANSRIINSSILILSAIMIKISGYGLIAFGTSFILARGAACTYSLMMLKIKFFTPKISFTTKNWKSLLTNAWPFGLTLILTNIFQWTDQVVIKHFWGNADVGYYSAAYKIVLALHFLPMAFNQSIYPVLSRQTKDTPQFKKTAGLFLKYMIIIAIPLTVGLGIQSDEYITLLYGTQYQPSIQLLQILVWSFLLIALASPFHRILEAIGKQKLILKAITTGVFLNILLNLLFIPTYGSKAAAISTILTGSIFLIIPLNQCRKLGLTPEIQTKTILSTILGIILILMILKSGLNTHPLIKTILSGITYLIIQIIFRQITPTDLNKQ